MKNVKNRSKFHKKWPTFAIILPWMASYGSETSFLLISSARDDLVKVSWKSDGWKCQNQVTSPFFDKLSERCQPLWNGSASMFHNVLLIAVPVDGLSNHQWPVLCFQGKWDLCKCGNCDFLMPPIKYSISGNGFSLSGFYLNVIGAVGRSCFRGFCEIFPILLIKLWNCTKAKSWVQLCPAPAAGYCQYPVQLLTCNLVPQNHNFQSVLSDLSPIICLVMSLTH